MFNFTGRSLAVQMYPEYVIIFILYTMKVMIMQTEAYYCSCIIAVFFNMYIQRSFFRYIILSQNIHDRQITTCSNMMLIFRSYAFISKRCITNRTLRKLKWANSLVFPFFLWTRTEFALWNLRLSFPVTKLEFLSTL